MESLTETLAGAMIGTPRYFSPEQFRGTKRDIDHRTDLYALGVLIYEAAVGRHPSMTDRPRTIEQLSDAVCNSESFINNTTFKTLPPNLNLLVRRLLEKERARRPANAKLVGQILRNLWAAQ
jgi:serine/threonine-protein kinase